MGDAEYEKAYKERKKKLRKLHENLRNSKEVQEIYHKIMGSNADESDGETEESEE